MLTNTMVPFPTDSFSNALIILVGKPPEEASGSEAPSYISECHSGYNLLAMPAAVYSLISTRLFGHIREFMLE
jgi:hypothetical protein